MFFLLIKYNKYSLIIIQYKEHVYIKSLCKEHIIKFN